MGIPIVFFISLSVRPGILPAIKDHLRERERKNDKLAQKPQAQVQNSKTQMDKVILNNKKMKELQKY